MKVILDFILDPEIGPYSRIRRNPIKRIERPETAVSENGDSKEHHE